MPWFIGPHRAGSVARAHLPALQAWPRWLQVRERDLPEGHQLEDLHAYDLALPAGLQPTNQDGEVQAFQCLPVADALALAAGCATPCSPCSPCLSAALKPSERRRRGPPGYCIP